MTCWRWAYIILCYNYQSIAIMPVRQGCWGLVQRWRDCAVGSLQRSLLCLTCIEISLLQCYEDRFPSSLSPTKVLSLIKAVFLLGKTIICLLAVCVCVWCVVFSVLKTWVVMPIGEGARVSQMTHGMTFLFLEKGSGGREQFNRKETNCSGYSVATRCKHSEVFLKLRIF